MSWNPFVNRRAQTVVPPLGVSPWIDRSTVCYQIDVIDREMCRGRGRDHVGRCVGRGVFFRSSFQVFPTDGGSGVAWTKRTSGRTADASKNPSGVRQSLRRPKSYDRRGLAAWSMAADDVPGRGILSPISTRPSCIGGRIQGNWPLRCVFFLSFKVFYLYFKVSQVLLDLAPMFLANAGLAFLRFKQKNQAFAA